MKLDLKKLQEIGAFVGAPVERTIKWSQAGDDGSAVEYEGVWPCWRTLPGPEKR